MNRGPTRNDGVVADALFVGLTRPALALGVPYSALLVNVLVTLELFLTTRNLLCVLICLPLHGLAWLACLAEPRFFELVAVWGSVRSRRGFASGRDWRAHSYGCLHGRSRSGVPCAVVESSEAAPCVGR